MLDIKNLENIINQSKPDDVALIGGRDGPSSLKELYDKDIKPFKNILNQETVQLTASELKFSNHATARLHSRDISLTNLDKKKIVDGVNKLREKGAKDALILLKDISMIISVQNKTVVTAMDAGGANGDGIFTNIDSAILL